MRLFFTRVALALMVAATAYAPSQAGTITFGSGGNTFNMEFVTIGNPGNAADTDPNADPLNAGAVGYTYDIAKFEVSEDMIAKYNANFGTANGLVISTTANGPNKPAGSITWNEAARFVNWLNTSTGNQAAYKFITNGVNDDIALWASGDAGYDVNNRYRNKLAKYVLPSYNEWYKAAYYDPNKSGVGIGGYWDYATGSDSAPTAVASGTGTGVNGNNEAVYFQSNPADVTQAGGLSPYGVMGLGGNHNEWEESSWDLTTSNGSNYRGFRGGNFFGSQFLMKSSSRGSDFPNSATDDYGFRVASLSSSDPPAVPEPSMMVIGTLFGLGGLATKRRMKK